MQSKLLAFLSKKGLWMCILSASVLLSGCSLKKEPELFRYQATFLGVFDTVTTVVGYAEDKETFTGYTERLKEELTECHQLFDIYNDYEGINNIKTINDHAGIQPVKVDQRIIDLLLSAEEMYGKTDGMMNAAMGSVLSIWHDYRMEGIDDPEHASLPPEEDLIQAAEHTDISRMKIDKDMGTVFLEDPRMSLDVGAIGKGFATEYACRVLEEMGADHMLVSVGGNTRAIGSKLDDRGREADWEVGIQNPDLKSEIKNLHVMKLPDGLSLVQSGSYQRYYTVDGVQYHHIIKPKLLYPWNRYVSVAILCRDSGMADALSTAVFNMEPEVGMAFIEGLDETEAMWIMPDGTEQFSSGFEKFMNSFLQ